MNFRLKRFIACLLVAGVGPCLVAWAGELRTLNGELHQGIVVIDPAGYLLTTDRDGQRQVIQLPDVLDAVLHEPEHPPVFEQGVQLIDGSSLAGRIGPCDLSAVRLHRNDADISIPIDSIARICYGVPGPQDDKMLAGDRPGALLANGDFFAASLKGFAAGNVQLSSVIFGIRQFAPTTQIKVLVLATVQPEPCNWIIALMDGSIIRASDLVIGHGQLTGTDPAGKPFSFTPEQVLRISCGPARRRTLIALPAESIQATGLPMLINDQTITQSAESSIAFILSGDDPLLDGQIRLPRDFLPMVQVRFIIRGDGQILFKSDPLTSLDEPHAFSIPVAGVKRLELQLESSQAADLGGKGQWINLQLISSAPPRQP